MSEVLKRDENRKTVAGAITNDSSQDIEMLRIDPVTKYLLVDLTSTGATSANAGTVASRDENHRPVCLAWDETNQCLQEVLTDSSGRLLCDLVFV